MSRDKRKIYLHYQDAYGHKIWQGDELPWVTSIRIVTWPCNLQVS